jgi:hypothetical protein
MDPIRLYQGSEAG